MAFTYFDTTTSKSTFDLACSEMIARDTSGAVYKIVENGAVYIPDWRFPFGYNAKQAVLAITAISSPAPTDLDTCIAGINELKTKFNELLSALKTA